MRDAGAGGGGMGLGSSHIWGGARATLPRPHVPLMLLLLTRTPARFSAPPPSSSSLCPPAAGQCVRLLLLGDILAAADFPRDRLYVEYAVRWDPEAWDLVTAWPQQEPGIVQVSSAHGAGGGGDSGVRPGAMHMVSVHVLM